MGKRTQSENCLQTGMDSQTQITNLKNEIAQVLAELNAKRESKQSMQRSKSCSETDFLSNLRNQSKEIKELKDKNEKMNEKYQQMSGKVDKLENDLQAANARHGALYKLYCDEVEKNKKWAEIDSDYKKLQKEKNELVENEKRNRNLRDDAVQKLK